MNERKINISDMDVLFRDLEESANILKDEYFMKFEIENGINEKKLISYIHMQTKTELKKLGITSEKDLNIFDSIDENELDESYQKYALFQIYTYLLRNINSEKNPSLLKYLNDGTDKSETKASNFVMYINRYKNNFLGFNILSGFFHIQQKNSKDNYEVKEPLALCELFKYICNHPKSGPFKNTFFHEEYNTVYTLKEYLNDDIICNDIDMLKIKLSVLEKDCGEFFYHYKNDISFEEIMQKMCNDAKDILYIYGKQQNVYNIMQEISNQYDLLSDLIDTLDFIINGCRIIYESNNDLEKIRFLYKYNMSAYHIFDSKNIKYILNSKFENLDKYEKHIIDKRFSKQNLKISTDNKNNTTKNYLQEAYKKITKPKEKERAKEIEKFEKVRLYFCEQMLHLYTAEYLTQKIVSANLHKDMIKLEEQILPYIVYIFMIPNLFIRNIYIDTIIDIYEKGKLYYTDSFHHTAKFDPLGGIDANNKTVPLNNANNFIKRILIHQSLTYSTMYEACFYGYLREYFENDKQKITQFIENTIEEHSITYPLKRTEHKPYSKADNTVFIKIYEAIRKYLFNDIMLKRWKDGQNLDYIKLNPSRFKMMLSILEYEKTNSFTAGKTEYFNIDNYE